MIINLTPHQIQIYSQESFVGLESPKPGVLVADSVTGNPAHSFPSEGCARIATKSQPKGTLGDDIPLVETTYGDATGIPADVEKDDILVVSLPMLSMAKAAEHPLAGRMVAPYKVVRSKTNGSLVLGCMGFTK